MPTSFIQEMSDLQKQGGIFAGVKQLFAQYYASQLNTTLKEIQLANKDVGKLETTEETIGKIGTKDIKIKTYGNMLEEIDNMRKGMTEQQNTFMSYLPIISYGNPELADRMTRSFFQNLGNDMNNVKIMQDQVQLMQANEYQKANTEINLLKADRDKFSVTKFDNVVKNGKTYEQAWAINADNPEDTKLVKEVEVQGKGGSGSGAKFDKDVRSLFDPKENDAEIISLRTKIAGLQKFNTPQDLIAFKKAQGNTFDTDQVTGDTVKQFNEQQDKLKRDYTGLLTDQYYQKYLKRYQEGERTDGIASAWNEIVTLLNDGTKESKKAINILRVNIGQSMGQKPEEVAIPFPEVNRPEPDEKISTRFNNLEYKHVERFFAKYGLNSSTLTKESAANFKEKLINDPEFRNEFKRIDNKTNTTYVSIYGIIPGQTIEEEDANMYQNRLQEYVNEIFRYGKNLIIGKK